MSPWGEELWPLLGNLRSYDGNCNENVTLKLNFALCLLRLFHVDHVVQNRRSYFRLLCTNGFHVKAKSERFSATSSRCRQNLKYENFTSSFGRLRQNIAAKSVPHVEHDCFSSFNQSNHWFVALSLTLPSSNLKLPNYCCAVMLLLKSEIETFHVVVWHTTSKNSADKVRAARAARSFFLIRPIKSLFSGVAVAFVLG